MVPSGGHKVEILFYLVSHKDNVAEIKMCFKHDLRFYYKNNNEKVTKQWEY